MLVMWSGCVSVIQSVDKQVWFTCMHVHQEPLVYLSHSVVCIFGYEKDQCVVSKHCFDIVDVLGTLLVVARVYYQYYKCALISSKCVCFDLALKKTTQAVCLFNCSLSSPSSAWDHRGATSDVGVGVLQGTSPSPEGVRETASEVGTGYKPRHVFKQV